MAHASGFAGVRVRRAGMELFRRTPKPLRGLVIRLLSPSFSVGAVVCLRRADGSILLVSQRHTGAWAFPGGLLRRGEDAAIGAARETAEEVGLRVDLSEASPPRAVLHARHRTIDLVYELAADADTRAERADPVEVTGIGWFGLDVLPPLTEPTEAIVAMLRGRTAQP